MFELKINSNYRYIFWTDWSEVHPKIERAGMDGDSLSRRTILEKDLGWPAALTIDRIVQRLFFADTKLLRIETIKYDGSGRTSLVSKGIWHPLGLAVFEDRLYYTDYAVNTIFTIDRRSGKRLGQLKNNLKKPTGLNVVHPVLQKQGRQHKRQTGQKYDMICKISCALRKTYYVSIAKQLILIDFYARRF